MDFNSCLVSPPAIYQQDFKPPSGGLGVWGLGVSSFRELTSSYLPSCIYPQPPKGGFDLKLHPEFAPNLMVWILILALYHLQLYTSRISSPPWGVWGSWGQFVSGAHLKLFTIMHLPPTPQGGLRYEITSCITPQPPKGGLDLKLHPEFATNLMVWILILALYHLQLYTSRISSPPWGVWGSWGFGG